MARGGGIDFSLACVIPLRVFDWPRHLQQVATNQSGPVLHGPWELLGTLLHISLLLYGAKFIQNPNTCTSFTNVHVHEAECVHVHMQRILFFIFVKFD